MSTQCQVNVYVFCGGCGKEIDSSCYPGTSTRCTKCQEKVDDVPASSLKLEDLTYEELSAEMDEVDDARKQLCRQLKGKVWSEDDKALLYRMNRWAQRVFDELRAR